MNTPSITNDISDIGRKLLMIGLHGGSFLSWIYSLGVIMTYPKDSIALLKCVLISVSMDTEITNDFLVAWLNSTETFMNADADILKRL